VSTPATGEAIEGPGPARLLATLAGAALLVYGIVGFFHNSSFASPGDVRDALGLLSVNGWANSFHMLTGAAGLLLAGFAARAYVLWIAAIYAAIALLGSVF
jgi:Domain of unknown function (DUF4383)